VLARLKAPLNKEALPIVVSSLLTLDERLQSRKVTVDTNWPARLAEVHARLAERLPGLNAALLADKRFGRTAHVVFTRARGIDRAAALERFLAQRERIWNAEWVRLLSALPAERALPVARELWGKAGVEEELLPLLARHGNRDDRPRLITGLTSARLQTVRVVLSGLERLDPDASETLPLVRGLTDHHEKDANAWIDWARKRFPDQAAALANLDGVDEAAWKRRLERVDWKAGDAKRGAAVFVQARCATCHSGAAALGPDLAGVGKRFSRNDLLTALIQPSKDVSPRYRTTRLITERGIVHQGIIIYDAPGSVIVQTGPVESVRLSGRLERTPSPRSLMPAGLLDPLRDEQIADLLAYLAER
jgi:putative heme-binding domain-containing protein